MDTGAFGGRLLINQRSYFIVLGIGFQYPLSVYISQALIHLESLKSDTEISAMKRFKIGVISRVCTGMLFYPLYTLRTKMQMKQLSEGTNNFLFLYYLLAS